MPPMLTSVKGMMLALFAQWIGDVALAQVAGHADPKTTMRIYIHANDTETRAAIEGRRYRQAIDRGPWTVGHVGDTSGPPSAPVAGGRHQG